jgi:regulatory protein
MATITKTERLRDGGIKVHTSTGSSFFMRACYLEGADETVLVQGIELAPQIWESFFAAAQAYLAERKALTYINRSEQSRFLLTQKLRKKNFGDAACEKSLNYLETTGALCDARFARAWLAERGARKPQGRMRLLAELVRRGISGECAQHALDEFFSEYSEEEALGAAYEKARRLGKSDVQAQAYLRRQGFSFALIRRLFGDDT